MEAWRQILDQLRLGATPESFENWLEPVRYSHIDDSGVMHLVAPNRSVQDLLRKDFKQKILDAAIDLGMQLRDVEFAHADGPLATRPAPDGLPPSQQHFDFKARSSTVFNEKYTFSSFVVGSCNEFAHAAAQAVAGNPAKAYNPLYIYGGVGMGKTHLMHAIAQQLEVNNPGMRVVYVSAEEFMNDMINSIRYDRMTSFHQRFRSADALLVDDIQVLGSRERTQEEFFHTFNALHNMQKQIVISSDLPPKQVPGLVDRLRSRFAWGLMADIQPPDLETKMAILDRKAAESEARLPDEVRAYLATHLKTNIRELEGVLIRLIAIASVSSSNCITMGMAKQALYSIVGLSESKKTITAIQRAVAEEFDMRPEQLREKSNAKAIAYPRQVAMYLCKELLGSSLPEIGKAFGGKHHTTVLHAVNKIEGKRQSDDELNSTIHKLTDRFN